MSNLGRPTSRVHPTPPGKPCICRVGDNHSAARLHLCPPPSTGIDYKTTTILLDGRRVKLQLW